MKRALKEETTGAFENVLSFLSLAIFLFLFISIQTALSLDTAIFGAASFPAFVFCVCYSVKQGGTRAIVVSFLCGFLLDALCGTAFPYSALLYGYISMGCVYVKSHLFRCSFYQTILFVCLASLFLSAATIFVESLFTGFDRVVLMDVKRSVIQAIYHVVIAVFIYPLASFCTLSHAKERGNKGGEGF